MIFKVKIDENIRKTNDNIDSIAEFIPCNDKTLKFIFLMYDYESPYSRQPLEMRKSQVLTALQLIKQGTIDSFFSRNKEVLPQATAAFNKLQYDAQFETLISMKIQLDQWNDLLRDTKKTDKQEQLAQKVMDKLPDYMKRVKDMEEIVGYREVMEDEENGEKSSLELYFEEKHKKQLEG